MYIYIYIHTDHNEKHNLGKGSFKLKTPIKAFLLVFFSLCVFLFKLTAIYIFFVFVFLQSFLNIVQAGKTSLCTELYVCSYIVCSWNNTILRFLLSVCWVKAHRLFLSFRRAIRCMAHKELFLLGFVFQL